MPPNPAPNWEAIFPKPINNRPPAPLQADHNQPIQPTRLQILGNRVWSISEVPKLVYDHLTYEEVLDRICLSKASFPEAVLVLYDEWNLDLHKDLKIEEIQPQRLLLYLGAVRKIRFKQTPPTWLNTFEKLSGFFPNMTQLSSGKTTLKIGPPPFRNRTTIIPAECKGEVAVNANLHRPGSLFPKDPGTISVKLTVNSKVTPPPDGENVYQVFTGRNYLQPCFNRSIEKLTILSSVDISNLTQILAIRREHGFRDPLKLDLKKCIYTPATLTSFLENLKTPVVSISSLPETCIELEDLLSDVGWENLEGVRELDIEAVLSEQTVECTRCVPTCTVTHPFLDTPILRDVSRPAKVNLEFSTLTILLHKEFEDPTFEHIFPALPRASELARHLYGIGGANCSYDINVILASVSEEYSDYETDDDSDDENDDDDEDEEDRLDTWTRVELEVVSEMYTLEVVKEIMCISREREGKSWARVEKEQ